MENCKNLIPNSKYITSVKRLVTIYYTHVTSSKGIAYHLNKCFVNVGVTLAPKFSTDTSRINALVSEKPFKFSKTDTKGVEFIIKVRLSSIVAATRFSLEFSQIMTSLEYVHKYYLIFKSDIILLDRMHKEYYQFNLSSF